eukprot:CCRYP_014047-RB/>CCRYP_014047-RB protein AED:0.24 eAED:0.17 QI:0/0/0/1/0/0/2/0/324
MKNHYISPTVTADKHEFELYQSSLLSQVSAAIASTSNFFYLDRDSNYEGRIPGALGVKRTRLNIDEYVARLDDRNFRRKYRMDKEAFWLLLDILSQHMPETGENKERGGIPNGPITHGSRLSMALRYCLFGDNAYVNALYMCTRWKNVSGGPKDAMNFFHSSLRICIECAFGILVHRWGILRKPMPVNLSVQKISSLVLALCKLHNFCIDNASVGVERPEDAGIPNIVVEGGLFLPRMDNGRQCVWECDTNIYSQSDRLNEFLDGGAHMDDHTRSERRRYRYDRDLPCYRILNYFEEQALERPEYSARSLAEQRMELDEAGVRM